MRRILPLLFVFLLSAKPVHRAATSFYVDNSGSPACSDTGPGNSTTPWCTVAHAMGALQTMGAGDSILFRCGDTWNEVMTIPSNVAGASGSPITIGHYGTCVLPTYASYTGNNNSSSYTRSLPIINCGSTIANGIVANAPTGVSYLTIDGFDVHDCTQGGINFLSPSCGGMPGITLQNNVVHEVGGGAYAGATEGPDTTTRLCDAAAPNGAGPCDNGNYNLDGGISFTDDCAGGGNDGAQLLNNFVWDVGGHNALRLHFDSSTASLVQGNVVGPGCLHNCIDVKGVNATVSNNITTCPEGTARSPGGWGQCGAANAGYYTEVQGGTFSPAPTWMFNVAYDIGICGQLNGVTTSGNALHPNWWNNTCDNADGNGTLYTSSITAPCSIQKNIFGGTTAVHDTSTGCTWNYNNQFGASGAVAGVNDINVNPTYVNNTTNPKNYHTTNTTNNTAGAGSSVTGAAYIGAMGPVVATPTPTPTATPTSTTTPTPTATPTSVYQFPANPTVGQVVTGPGGQKFEWDGVKWIALGGSGGGGGGAPVTNPPGGVNNYAPINNPVFTGVVTFPNGMFGSCPNSGDFIESISLTGQITCGTPSGGGGGGPWLPVNNPAFTGNMTSAANSTLTIGSGAPQTFIDNSNVSTGTVNAGAGIIQTITSQDILLQAPNTSVPDILQVGINGGAQYLTVTGAGQVLLGGDATAPLGAVTLEQLQAATGGGGNFAPLVNPTGGQNNYAPIAGPTFTGTVTAPIVNVGNTLSVGNGLALLVGNSPNSVFSAGTAQFVNGILSGNAPGGNMGSGTVNATGYYLNGQPFGGTPGPWFPVPLSAFDNTTVTWNYSQLQIRTFGPFFEMSGVFQCGAPGLPANVQSQVVNLASIGFPGALPQGSNHRLPIYAYGGTATTDYALLQFNGASVTVSSGGGNTTGLTTFYVDVLIPTDM